MANQPDVRIRLTAEGVKEVVQALQQVQAQANKSAQQTNKVSSGFDATTKSVAALKGAVGALAAAAAGLVALDKMREWAAYGLEVNGAFEKTQLSLAGVLASQAKLVDSNGNVLKGQDAYAAAVQLSADYMAGLQEKAAAAGVDYASLAKQSSLLVFTGLNAGVKDMGKLQELTVLSAAMMRTFGEDTEATSEQLKTLLRGEGSDISDALGIDDDTLKSWKDQGTLVDEVIKRLNASEAATKAYANSWDGVKGKMKAAFDQLTGGAFAGMFEKLKTGLGSAVDGLYEKTGKLNPEVKAVVDLFNDVGSTLGGAISAGIGALVDGLKTAGAWLTNNSKLVSAIGAAFSDVVSVVGKALNGFAAINDMLSLTTRTVAALAGAFNVVAGVINLAQEGVAKLLQNTTSDETKKAFYANEAALANKRAELNRKNALDSFKTMIDGAASGSQGGAAATAAASSGAGKGGAKVAGAANKSTADEAEAAKLAKAAADAAAARADMELKLLQAKNQLLSAEERKQFEQGLLMLEEYHNRRIAAVQAESDQEMRIAQLKLKAAEAMPGRTKEEVIARDKAIFDAKMEMQVKEKQAALANLEAQKQKTSELRALDIAQIEMRQKILELTGNQKEAAALALDVEIAKTKELLEAQGATAAERDRILSQMREAGEKKNNSEEATTKGNEVLRQLDIEQRNIERGVKIGTYFPIEAEQRLKEAIEAQLPALRQQVELLRAAGETVAADNLEQKLLDLAASVDYYGHAIARLKQTIQDSLMGGLNKLFDSLIEGTASAKDAFRAFALDVVNSIRKVAQELLIQQMFRALFAGGDSSWGSAFSRLIGGGGQNVPAAAGFADGGYISGPGTATSDSIPAMLSNGEYVIRAAAVQSLGVGLLDMLNRHGSLHPVMANKYALGGIQKYADGGLVGSLKGSQQGGGESSLTVGLDDGLVLKKLSSPEGHKLIVEAIGNNRRAVRQIIG